MGDRYFQQQESRKTFSAGCGKVRCPRGAKSNFLATISHEIRTPMQSVYGLLELIEQNDPPPEILTMAQTAKNSASGLLEILDDVLDFAKMDAEQLELDLFEVPVRRWPAAFWRPWKSRCREKI